MNINPILNLSSIFNAALMGFSLLWCDEAKGDGEWFAPTSETRLHGAVVDAETGKPITGARVRVLGGPRMRMFKNEEVTVLGKSLYLFDDCKVATTDAKGMITLPSSLYLACYCERSIAEENRAFVVVSAPKAKPYTASFYPVYARVERADGYRESWGKVKASYMPLLAVVPDSTRKELYTQTPQQLSIEGLPPVVRIGKTFDLRVKWKFVMMPFMQSDVQVTGAKAVRESSSGNSGQVVETWVAKGLKAGKKSGPVTVPIFAHLDAPRTLLRANSIAATYYVAESEAEEDAYHRILTAGQSPPPVGGPSQAEVCEEVLKSMPKFAFAWERIVAAHMKTAQWQELLTLWDRLPSNIKRRCDSVIAHCMALEKLGRKEESIQALIDFTNTDNATPAILKRAIEFAIKDKNFDVAVKIANDKRVEIGIRDWAKWVAGDCPKSNSAAIHAATEFYLRDLTKEGLEAISNVIAAQLKGDQRSEYYTCLILLYLDAKDTGAAEKALAEWMKLDKKRASESGSLQAKVALAKGDFQSAITLLQKQEKAQLDEHLAASNEDLACFAQAVKGMVEKQEKDDPTASTYGAFTLLAAHQFKSALPLANDAAQKNPNSPVAALALGLAREMTGDFDGAVTFLELAIEKSPEDPYLKMELERARSLANPSIGGNN